MREKGKWTRDKAVNNTDFFAFVVTQCEWSLSCVLTMGSVSSHPYRHCSWQTSQSEVTSAVLRQHLPHLNDHLQWKVRFTFTAWSHWSAEPPILTQGSALTLTESLQLRTTLECEQLCGVFLLWFFVPHTRLGCCKETDRLNAHRWAVVLSTKIT